MVRQERRGEGRWAPASLSRLLGPLLQASRGCGAIGTTCRKHPLALRWGPPWSALLYRGRAVKPPGSGSGRSLSAAAFGAPLAEGRAGMRPEQRVG